ncbi:MAG: redoxin family protein [Myxococcota bacterium]
MMRVTTAAAILLALASCGDDDGAVMCDLAADGTCPAGCPTDPDCVPSEDSGTGGTDSATDFACDYPTGPYGTRAGRILEPFTLDQCDGTSYSFVNEDFCDPSHRLTVISIAAGWCMPCIIESQQLTEEITERYRADGVRVIQILTQDQNFREPTQDFCSTWVERFNLTNVELIDPAQITNIYFPDNALPSTIIVDSTGTIRFRENGAADGLLSLRSKIEEFLAEDAG